MKRVTILVDDIGEPDEDGERLVVGTRGVGDQAYVAADRVLSVEDHIEPLPTEPGVRFWGRRGDDAPQWWFVRQPGVGGVYYLPSRDGTSVYVDDVQSVGLVRLSDPKPTEAADR